ncbi:hypothetical protein IF650_02785 [Cellulosimicrobium terreum]|nr:hypothetical protein [Cellulosimicrobium terreum]
MGREPFLTTTDDEPGDGPDLPGVEQGDTRGRLERLLGERRRPTLQRSALPKAALPKPSFPRLTMPRLAVPKRLGREPADAVDPELDTALEDALVEALSDEDTTPGAEDAEDAPSTDGPGEPDESTGLDDAVAEWVLRAIAAYPRPAYPVEREWDVSVQGIVRLVPYVPRIATAPLGLLDRFGAVTIGPDRVGLDGKDVAWDRVVEVRTEPAWTCLSAEALEANLAQYVVAIPPVPGRGWVLRKISELLLTLYLAVVPPDDGEDGLLTLAAQLEDPDAPGMFDRVVTEVVYERRFGHGTARASTTSALLQLVLPGTVDTMVRTAISKGVTVVHVPAEETSSGGIVARAVSWRSSALDLRARVNHRIGR